MQCSEQNRRSAPSLFIVTKRFAKLIQQVSILDPAAFQSASAFQRLRFPLYNLPVGSSDYPPTQMKKRVFNYLIYVFLAVPRVLFLPCDVILAMTDPPFEGIVGAFVALVKRKPYIYNIRDLYPDMAVG